jgi:hypothetical protein
MVAGAGKIGRLIACLLADTKDYKVYLSDCDLSGHECIGKITALFPNSQKY